MSWILSAISKKHIVHSLCAPSLRSVAYKVYRSFQSLSFARKLAPTIVHFVHISFIYTHSIPQQALRYCSFAALLSVAVRSYQLTSNNDVFIPFNRSLCYLFVHVVHSYKAHLDYMSFGHRGFGLKASLAIIATKLNVNVWWSGSYKMPNNVL